MKKVAIVTGASRGIGAATALRLARDGYEVCVNYKASKKKADQVVRAIREHGGIGIAVQADIAVEDQVLQLFNTCYREFGGLTALVNNAAVLMPQMRVEEMEAARVNAVFATNVIGSFLCCREAIKKMSTDSGGAGGVIVNVSSVAGRLGSPGEYVDYAASKGAVDTLTIGLANEVAAQGIRVNAVRPGFIYTDMHRDGGEPNRVDRIKSSLPMQRGGEAHEVAAAIAWLVSSESSYSTGTIIDVSGGR